VKRGQLVVLSQYSDSEQVTNFLSPPRTTDPPARKGTGFMMKKPTVPAMRERGESKGGAVFVLDQAQFQSLHALVGSSPELDATAARTDDDVRALRAALRCAATLLAQATLSEMGEEVSLSEFAALSLKTMERSAAEVLRGKASAGVKIEEGDEAEFLGHLEERKASTP